MTDGRYSRRNASFRPTGSRRSDRDNNFFLGVVGFSLVVHVLVAAIFSHNPTAPIQRRPPTLSVELVMAPVANPQRGSAGAVRKIAAPVAVEKVPVLPSKVAKEEVILKGKDPKPADVKDDDGIEAAMNKMKERKKEQDELKDALAAIDAFKKRTPAIPQTKAAVGSSSGTGDEAGGDISAWLQSAVKAKWNWPTSKRKDLSAEVLVEFDSAGKLSYYKLTRPSGDLLFDKSLTNALLKLEVLPKTIRKSFKEKIIFNLEELQQP